MEIYNSLLKITEENNKFELYTDNFDEFSVVNLKSEVEEILGFSKITSEHLQDNIKGPSIFSADTKLETEKTRTDGYTTISMAYARFPFRDFESFLRFVVG